MRNSKNTIRDQKLEFRNDLKFMAGEKENEKMYDVSALGFGDNVVDKYEHIKTMYPGGNCVNFAVYAKMFGAKRSAYMGYFGNDAEAEHVMYALDDIGIETVKCKQLEGENGCARATLVDGDRVFLGSNEGGIRGKHHMYWIGLILSISDSLILYILEIIVLWRKNFQKSMRRACRFHLIFQMTQKILIMRR